MKILAYGLTDDIPAQLGKTVTETGHYLRDLGINAVFLKHLDRDWCLALQDAGLRVYASTGVFIANADLWQRIPESRPITASGEPAPAEEWYRPALPSLPGVRQLRLQQIEEIARDLPIDGLWLDFIRWPARWEKRHPNLYHSSFDPITLGQFHADTDIDLPANASDPVVAASWILANEAEAWSAWRCRLIAAFVNEARTLLNRHRPGATLGAFTVPWTGGTLDGLCEDQAHIRIVGQDPALLGPCVDVLSPMVYHRLCGHDMDWPRQVTNALRSQVECEVWPTVEAMPGDGGHDTEEFASVCEITGNAGSGGLIVFNLVGLLEDSEKLAGLARF